MLKKNQRLFYRRLFAFGGGILTLLIIAIALWIFSLLHDLPDPKNLPQKLHLPSVQIQDRNGFLLYEDLGEFSVRHRPISYEELPECIINATVATEDRSFFTNPGFDLKAMVRAVWTNLRGGQILAGGSTITQQVVRNLLMSGDESSQRTIQRKLREIVLAWRLSRQLLKQEILTLYLNQTYYGSFAYGVEAAAQTYFGKSIPELTLAECALIAGLPQSPAQYNPFIYPDNARERQKIVLERLFREGYISSEEKQKAEAQPLIFAEQPYPLEAPHFVMFIRNAIDQMESDGTIPPQARRNGLVVRTTLDLNWQRLAEQAIQHHLQHLAQGRDGLGHNVKNAALVAIDPRNGAVQAMVGSPDYYNPTIYGAINMAIVPRQPGSALKPFIYALAMDPNVPNPLTPATLIDDVLTVFITRDQRSYIPVNYDGEEHGRVSVREALASSLNIPAVFVLNQIGLERFAAFMRTLGIQSLGSPDRYDLTIALGGGGVSLLELTAAYGVFANNGYLASPYWIESIADGEGNVYYQASQKTRKVLDERVAWLISDILSDDQARYIGFGKNSVLNLDRPAAVKTGTTTDFHDNWTIGYTSSLIVGVWVGNADYEPMVEVTGLTGAAPIWHGFIRSVLTNRPLETFQRPEGLTRQTICKTFHPNNHHCLQTLIEWFIIGTQPDLNTSSSPIRPSSVLESHFSVLSPRQNGVYFLPPYSAQNSSKLLIELRSHSAFTQFDVFIDGVLLATLETQPLITWWEMQVGQHFLRIESWQGENLVEEQTITFTVQPPLR